MSERDGVGKEGVLVFAGLGGVATLLACLGSFYVNAHSNTIEHRYGVLSWLFYQAIFVPASAQERLKVIASGPHLKDWTRALFLLATRRHRHVAANRSDVWAKQSSRD
jgi:hypothetical protein